MAPATRSTSSSLKMQFSEALGAQAPLGFWDPLGLLKDADQERFDRLRYVSQLLLSNVSDLQISSFDCFRQLFLAVTTANSFRNFRKHSNLHVLLYWRNFGYLMLANAHEIFITLRATSEYQLLV